MLNRMELIGNLGADPEMRFTPAGTPVVNLSVAVNQTYNNRDGEKIEDTLWLRVTVWGRMAEACNQYLNKGSKVYVAGRLQVRDYEDNEGNPRRSVEVVAQTVQFLSGNREGGGYNEDDESDNRAASDRPSGNRGNSGSRQAGRSSSSRSGGNRSGGSSGAGSTRSNRR